MNNLILSTDSYKLTHWRQYPADVQAIHSYMEAREGAAHPSTVFFGLQSILRNYLTGIRVTADDIEEARSLALAHFGTDRDFNAAGWHRIVEKHGGRLPVRIRAVPEGTVVPVGNVLMTVENTDPELPWLTNALESLLTHVWYPTTVATLSYHTKQMLAAHLDETADSRDALPFMLHDFGYRGASSHETAAIGGAAHLLNFRGTDTLPAMQLAIRDYDADPATLAFSVPATEHSVMTADGEGGEFALISRLLDEYPTGILSIVGDSYNIYRVAEWLGTDLRYKVLSRDGKVVLRPDSTTPDHPSPEKLTANLADRLWHRFGGATNAKGYKVLDPHIGLLWGDGIDPAGIERILNEIELHSFSAENMVFGMGGGLLQKVNRDTERFAFKASAMLRDGHWQDVSKHPLDASKLSKAGRLALVRTEDGFRTVRKLSDPEPVDDVLQTVFLNGELKRFQTFDEIRANTEQGVEAPALA